MSVIQLCDRRTEGWIDSGEPVSTLWVRIPKMNTYFIDPEITTRIINQTSPSSNYFGTFSLPRISQCNFTENLNSNSLRQMNLYQLPTGKTLLQVQTSSS